MAGKSGARSPGNGLRRLVRVLRDEGPKAAAIKILHELGIYRRLHLLDIPNEEAATPAGSDLRIEVEVLRPDDVDEYLALRPDQGRAEIEQRQREGHWCFVGRHEGRIVTSAWSCAESAEIEYLGCRLRLPPEAVFSYDVYTDPAYRGHRLSTVVFDWRRRYLREAGYPRGVGILWPENRAAARRLAHRRHRIFGTLEAWDLGVWKRHVLRPHRDAVGDGFPGVAIEGE